MKITIDNYTIENYNEVNISLRYNSIADTFGFKVFFDPNDAKMRAALKPFNYQKCIISHKGKTVITGTLLTPSFSSSAVPSLTTISGYSVTGILADCQLFTFLPTLMSSVDPNTGQVINVYQVDDKNKGSIEFKNLSLAQIAERIVSGLGIGAVAIDENVKDACNKLYTSIAAEPTQTISDFLDMLATHRGVVLSHTNDGHLLFTKCKAEKQSKTTEILVPVKPAPFSSKISGAPDSTAYGNSTIQFDSKPIYNFAPGETTYTNMDLKCDGQKMHSYIEVLAQTPLNDDGTEGNAAFSSANNPYVKNTFRYTRKIQTSGYDVDTPDTVRTALGNEIAAITLTIDIRGWELNGKLVTPNQIITAYNPGCYLYNKTRFFIEAVDLKSTPKGKTATLTCVLPYVYNDEDVVNIF